MKHKRNRSLVNMSACWRLQQIGKTLIIPLWSFSLIM